MIEYPAEMNKNCEVIDGQHGEAHKLGADVGFICVVIAILVCFGVVVILPK